MALTKKTMVLFPPALHRRLKKIAKERHTSLGELVRSACEREYCGPTREERIAAARALASMNLPVSDWETMERESTPDPESLAPGS
jgi:hypothetical protein